MEREAEAATADATDTADGEDEADAPVSFRAGCSGG
jgi:hypothetical protein